MINENAKKLNNNTRNPIILDRNSMMLKDLEKIQFMKDFNSN